MKSILSVLSLVTCALLSISTHAQGNILPDPTTGQFCQSVQKIMASTDRGGDITLFTDMPSYRHSKPSVDPHRIYQVVTYDGQVPIMVSCKMKGAAHLRSAYGEDAAGEQLFCPEITRRVKTQAIAELQRENKPEAAKAVKAFIIDENEPYITGQKYLSDFKLSYRNDDGTVHFNTPGLFQDYDSWVTWFLPEKFQGQVYCHIATVAYMKAVATGETEPGTIITTEEDAPVTPR